MEKLVAYFTAEWGRRKRLADALGIQPSAVTQWKRVPADRLIEIERVTGIPRAELRPDLFAPSSRPSTTEAA